MNSILAVDDTPANLTLLANLLGDEYAVKVAIDGERALKIALSANPPDLILLDVLMPGMDGFEVCRWLKANPLTSDIPVIFLTADNDPDSELRGFDLGAVDYITKPFTPVVVKARVSTHLALRRARQHLEAVNRQLEEEKELVANIINRMREAPGFCPTGLRSLTAPVESSNGDLLLSAMTPDGRRWILLGDMTGHGLPAAAACPLVAYIFYRAAREGDQAGQVLAAINRVLAEQLPANLYMAATFFEVTAVGNQCTIWNAGLPDCLLRKSSGAILRIPSSGLPLGVHKDEALLPDASQLATEEQDRLYVFTDGVTESCNQEGNQLQVAGVEQFLADFDPVGLPLETFYRFLAAHRQDEAFDDDITFVEVLLKTPPRTDDPS